MKMEHEEKKETPEMEAGYHSKHFLKKAEKLVGKHKMKKEEKKSAKRKR